MRADEKRFFWEPIEEERCSPMLISQYLAVIRHPMVRATQGPSGPTGSRQGLARRNPGLGHALPRAVAKVTVNGSSPPHLDPCFDRPQCFRKVKNGLECGDIEHPDTFIAQMRQIFLNCFIITPTRPAQQQVQSANDPLMVAKARFCYFFLLSSREWCLHRSRFIKLVSLKRSPGSGVTAVR